MEQNPFAPVFEDLPEILAVFPLEAAFLLPTGHLPLNVFEPRYVQMVEDALRASRMIGMIQPRIGVCCDGKPALYTTGCAGKIIEFTENSDGRYTIKLAGLYRFDIIEELVTPKLYRMVKPDWTAYRGDSRAFQCLDLDRVHLKTLLKAYFEKHEMACDWKAVEGVPDGKLITCLSMVCPFDVAEKQALLEAQCCRTRAELFMAMLEIALHERPLKGCH